MIVNVYNGKSKALGVKFAADVVGAGEMALRTHLKHRSKFLQGHVIPIYAG